MIKKTLYLLTVLSVIFVAGCVNSKQKPEEKIRIGWQTTRSTQGQLVSIFKNTDILKQNGLTPSFIGVSYGGPLNEAAMAGEVDVVLTADQPAATLLSKNPNWTIIGRLMYNRVSLYVPKSSDIISVEQLKGKTVAMPFGASAQRMAIEEEIKAGLDPKKDVKNINLGIIEQGDLVKDSNAKTWGNIDAMAGFDPTPAIFQERGLINILKTGQVVSVIMMSNDFIKKNPDAPKKLITSFIDAYDFYRQNISQANKRFVAESNLNISDNAFKTCSDIELNVSAKSKKDIRVNFNESDLKSLQNAADFLYNQGLIKTNVIMKNFIKTDF